MPVCVRERVRLFMLKEWKSCWALPFSLRMIVRRLMNLLQMEYDLLPVRVLKEDKITYIQALVDTRNNEDINIFSGKRFDEEDEKSSLDFQDMISIDTNMLSSAFGMKISEKDIADMTSGYMADISASIKAKQGNLVGNMASQGTTPRRITDLLASLADLTTGSGDRQTPVVYIKNYL